MLLPSLAALLSGAAGLAYQMAWTRMILSVATAAVWAQAFTVAVFLAGLAAGARLGASAAVRAKRPLLGYAAAELGAAALAVASGPVIEWSAGLRSAGGLGLQLGVLGLFLALPATLLGASAPFLIAGLPGTGGDRGRWAGWIYGVNTIGALAGTIASAWWSIERFGLRGSLLGGAALATFAAILALLASRRVEPSAVEATRVSALAPRWAAAAAAGGFVGVGAEVLWTRLVSLVVPNTVYAFAESTAGVLAGVGIAGIIARVARAGAAIRIASSFAALGAVMLAIGPMFLMSLASSESTQFALARGELGASIGVIAILMVPASAAIGVCLPMIVAAERDQPAASAFGRLYAWNAAGCVAGSLAVGFVLLPGLGLAWTLRVLVAGAVLVAVALARPLDRRAVVLIGLTALTGGLLSFSSELPRDLYRLRIPEDHEILEFREGVHSDVMVTDDAAGRRRLWINSVWVAGTAASDARDAGTPHRLLGHLPALFVEEPKRAIGIALGTGQTFASILDHGVTRFDCVEINADVITLSREWFRDWNGGFLDDPRVTVHHDDGRSHLRGKGIDVDLIVLEPLQAWSAGTSALYAKDFYEEAERRLARGGVVAQWLPLYGQGTLETMAMVRSAVEVFPEASLWLDGFDGILILGRAPFAIDPGELSRRIRSRRLERDIDGFTSDGALAILPLFVMGPKGLGAWSDGVDAITDDRPTLEFAAARRFGVSQSKEILESLLRYVEPPIAYARTSSSSALLEQAAVVQRALVEERALRRRPDERAAVLETALARVPGSRHLSARYRSAIIEWAKLDAAAARSIYRRGIEHDPDFGEALVNAAIVEIESGNRSEAASLLERARAIERTRPAAERILERLR
jgi:spermidine synthase